jgi:tRNA A22 N-methylase
MLNNEQIKIAKKLLCLKNKDSVILFSSRLAGWVNSQKKVTGNGVLKGINKILRDLQHKEIKEANELKKINLDKVKNPILRIYGKEIIELHIVAGLGARKIANYLLEKHNKKVSYGTIYNFLKKQKEKDTNG